MNGKRWRTAGLGSLLLLLSASLAPQAKSGQSVGGVYKITATTDLGDRLRVTMQIQMINSGDQEIFVNQMRLRGLHERSADQASSLILQPHSSYQFSQQFTVPKMDYQLWTRGARLRLGLKVQIGAEQTTMTIPLLPQPVAR